MLKINYGINRPDVKSIKNHLRRQFEHKNGKMDFPQFGPDFFNLEDEVFAAGHAEIRQAILAANPGWYLTGYAPQKYQEYDPEPTPARQFITIYVDNTEDAVATLRAFELLKTGCFIHAGLWDMLVKQQIPSLDWDAFEFEKE